MLRGFWRSFWILVIIALAFMVVAGYALNKGLS